MGFGEDTTGVATEEKETGGGIEEFKKSSRKTTDEKIYKKRKQKVFNFQPSKPRPREHYSTNRI